MSENIQTQNDVETTAAKTENGKCKAFFVRLGRGTKEFFRKRLVGLKRRPQNIALIVYLAALLTVTLNQTKISNTTAEIQLSNMGLAYFAALLFSILGFVCLLNAFPKRAKPKWVMLGLYFAMLAIIVVCDIFYYTQTGIGISERLRELQTGEEQMEFVTKYSYYYDVRKIMIVHAVLIVISGILAGLSPLIGKLLRKIKTSVNVESNDGMEAIEVEDD